jgi:hypothetical protein
MPEIETVALPVASVVVKVNVNVFDYFIRPTGWSVLGP